MEPPIWLKPTRNDRRSVFPHYSCPVYKTVARHGVLSTTGHSTNYIMPVQVPTAIDVEYWIKRGVAFLSQTDD